jgi:hypothetical protein
MCATTCVSPVSGRIFLKTHRPKTDRQKTELGTEWVIHEIIATKRLDHYKQTERAIRIWMRMWGQYKRCPPLPTTLSLLGWVGPELGPSPCPCIESRIWRLSRDVENGFQFEPSSCSTVFAHFTVQILTLVNKHCLTLWSLSVLTIWWYFLDLMDVFHGFGFANI